MKQRSTRKQGTRVAVAAALLLSLLPFKALADWDPGDLKASAKSMIQASLQGKQCVLPDEMLVLEVDAGPGDVFYDVKSPVFSRSNACIKALESLNSPAIQIIPLGSMALIRLRPHLRNSADAAANERFLPLSWEKTDKEHPERKSWSARLNQQISKHFEVLNASADNTYFCPNYKSLPKRERIRALAEIFVWTAYFESGFNPLSFEPDVAKNIYPNDYQKHPEAWSVGLYQMSSVDQSSYRLKLGYTFDPFNYPEGTPLAALPASDLRQPIPNIILATEIMKILVARHGKMRLRASESPYWSTLMPGGRYDKSGAIRDKIMIYMPSCKKS